MTNWQPPKRRRGDRLDARLLSSASNYQKSMVHAMPTRTESLIYLKEQICLDKLTGFIRDYNKNLTANELKCTTFDLFLAALIRTFALRPHLNRYVVGRRIYTRDYITIAFTIKKEFSDQAEESTVKLAFAPTATLPQIIGEIRKATLICKGENQGEDDKILAIIAALPLFCQKLAFWLLRRLDNINKLPKFIAEAHPLFASVFVSNLGSIGLNSAFHHLYEFGTASVFVVIGKIHKAPLICADDQIQVKRVIDLGITLDERISDGYYFARSVKLLSTLLQNPEKLLAEPEEIPFDR